MSIALSPALDTAKLDLVLERALAEGRLVGAEALLSVHGRVAYRRAAGWSDREAGLPMRPDGLFRLASLSKLYTSAAVIRLAARGALRLDAAVSDYLPYFVPRLADGSQPVITLRQLLSHTAGLGYGFLEPAGGGAYRAAGVSDGLDHTALSLEENLRRLAAQTLWQTPGQGWIYSLATDVLGGALEAATSLPLQEVIRREVSAPLGLADTDFHAVDPARLGAAYAETGDGPQRMGAAHRLFMLPELAGIAYAPDRALDKQAYPSGGAGMVGSAADFLTLLEALRGMREDWLPRAWIQEMMRDQIAGIDMEGWPGWGHSLAGAVLRDPAAAGLPASPGSWRWLGAYGHSWLVDPARGVSFVVCTHTALEGSVGAFSQEWLRAVYAALDTDRRAA
ncbi:serine hydrolase [Chromobacterium sp. IIBBL 290-4]|uniref:serine hydrolase domain-containing protein n=1 Tax=Chromobacterium sp. IIBBL 290-4 TaxID=2953890 RepID=UPI0020B691FE|nr:serine hydrolase domain-containing protein [Chromobacterium sp. IIBBL 290-4]UTH75709.1 beta-lactamase family protein [Chromobacterium sp. IIBBL 290-4]